MDEGKESRIRYRVIFSVLLIILIVLVSVLGYYRLPLIIEKFSLMEHIALYMKGEDEGLSITLPRILYSASGPVKDNVQIPVLNRDTLHLAAEAALLQPDDEDLANGLVSFIPEGTSLIGISEKGGYIYMVTDWEEYAEEVLEISSQEQLLVNPFGGFAPPVTWRPMTKFEQKGMEKEHPINEIWLERADLF